MKRPMSSQLSFGWSGAFWIWKGGRSELVIMERDPYSPRNGYSHKSYLKVLAEGLVPNYEPGRTFLQDNARIHTAKAVKVWFEQHGIWVQDHPPHSPDLNPIEHVWKAMKSILHRNYPDLHLLSDSEANIAIVDAALKDAWNRVLRRILTS